MVGLKRSKVGHELGCDLAVRPLIFEFLKPRLGASWSPTLMFEVPSGSCSLALAASLFLPCCHACQESFYKMRQAAQDIRTVRRGPSLSMPFLFQLLGVDLSAFAEKAPQAPFKARCALRSIMSEEVSINSARLTGPFLTKKRCFEVAGGSHKCFAWICPCRVLRYPRRTGAFLNVECLSCATT